MSKQLLDLVFPERCVGCHTYTSSLASPYICPDCFRTIELNNGFECIGCRSAVTQGQTCYLCREYYLVDRLFVVLNYRQHIVESALKGLKYRFIPDLAVSLTNLVSKYLKSKNFTVFDINTLVIPVPLHLRRYRLRGFNQSELIARNIASKYLLDFDCLSLVRHSPAKPQADIEDRETRLENIKNCFAVTNSEKIKNKNIILIDDICTTGATFNECAKVLKSAGARSVTAIAIARG